MNRRCNTRGQLTVRADSGFYAHALVSVCRQMDVRYSITIRQHQSLRNCQGRRENVTVQTW